MAEEAEGEQASKRPRGARRQYQPACDDDGKGMSCGKGRGSKGREDDGKGMSCGKGSKMCEDDWQGKGADSDEAKPPWNYAQSSFNSRQKRREKRAADGVMSKEEYLWRYDLFRWTSG